MEKYVIFILCVISLTVAPPPSFTKHYRSDYEYNRKADAFYKLHTEAKRHWQVSNVCKIEGGELMVPSSELDILQLHSMFKKYPDLGDVVWVGSDGKAHASAEEQPIIDLSPSSDEVDLETYGCDVVTRHGDVETLPCYRELPFICKVAAKDAPYDSYCDVYGKGYRYYPTLGSCYKIPPIAYTWSQAYADCQAQGAHLLVLNSQAEHDTIYNLTDTEPKVPGSNAFYFFFAGYRANKPTGNATIVFKTIFNQTLEEAGFSDWSANEPNNAKGREYCGCVFKNDGKLNDIDCSEDLGFICEKEISGKQ